jgi:hypothetical protein
MSLDFVVALVILALHLSVPVSAFLLSSAASVASSLTSMSLSMSLSATGGGVRAADTLRGVGVQVGVCVGPHSVCASLSPPTLSLLSSLRLSFILFHRIGRGCTRACHRLRSVTLPPLRYCLNLKRDRMIERLEWMIVVILTLEAGISGVSWLWLPHLHGAA